MSKYSVFKPKSARGMFVDYPELKTLKAFALLRPEEMLFVWYLACESSPLNDDEEKEVSSREKIQRAIELSYRAGKINKITKVDADKMLDGRFSEKMSAAIEQMERFKVGPRVRAKQMTEKAFDNLERILDVDVSKEKDMTKQKAYVDIVEKGLKIMPKIVESIEGGYRLVEEKEDEDSSEDGLSMIDKFHNDIDSN